MPKQIKNKFFAIRFCAAARAILLAALLWPALPAAGQGEIVDPRGVQEELRSTGSNRTELEYHRWKNVMLIQLELLLPDIAESLSGLDDSVSNIAITEFTFDPQILSDTRKIMRAKLSSAILSANPSLKLINCERCSEVRSELKGGVLRISRGISDGRNRGALAKELNVQAFINATFSVKDEKLVTLIEVLDAEGGRIILSDVFTSESPTPTWIYQNITFGVNIYPIAFGNSSIEVNQIQTYVVATESYRKFTENAGFGYRLYGLFGTETLRFTSTPTDASLAGEVDFGVTGLGIEGSLFRHFYFSGGRVILSAGGSLGQSAISAGDETFFPTYAKLDLKFILNDEFIIGMEGNFFKEKDLLEAGEDLGTTTFLGSAAGVYMGYQF